MLDPTQNQIVNYLSEVSGIVLQKFCDRLPEDTRDYPAIAIRHNPESDEWELRLIYWKPEVPAPDKLSRIVLLSDISTRTPDQYARQFAIDAGLMTIPQAASPIGNVNAAIAAQINRYILEVAVDAVSGTMGVSLDIFSSERGRKLTLGMFWGEDSRALRVLSVEMLAQVNQGSDTLRTIAYSTLKHWGITKNSKSPGVLP